MYVRIIYIWLNRLPMHTSMIDMNLPISIGLNWIIWSCGKPANNQAAYW
jgi:hypothetical protein